MPTSIHTQETPR